MPKEGDRKRILLHSLSSKNFRIVLILFLLSSVLLGALLYFIIQTKRFESIVRTKDTANNHESIFPLDEKEEKLEKKYQYSSEANLPEFIIRESLAIPPEANLNYKKYEYVAVRVVSTGEVSESQIRDTDDAVIAYTIQLKVLIDDKKGFLSKQEPLFLALKIFPVPNTSGSISPINLLQAAVDIEEQRLTRELEPISSEDYNELNEKLDTYADEVFPRTYERDFLDELFKEGTVWTFVPFLSVDDHLGEYSQKADYLKLFNEYYGLDGSMVLEKILADDLENTKEPILGLELLPLNEDY